MERENAPAKINLALAVTGRRDDGYHLLESLVVFTRFGDRISGQPGAHDDLRITGPFADQLAQTDIRANLVVRARDLLRSHLEARGQSGPAVALTIEKNLPVASGIGGGSADAAATLRLLKRLWQADVPDAEMMKLGEALGADVPMCFVSTTGVARGIGEIFEARPLAEPLHMVLANPGVAIPTPGVFKLLACAANPPLPALPAVMDGQSVARWVASARNDLAQPARSIAPEVTSCLNALERAGARVAAMSGSGASCFGLFADAKEAEAAAGALEEMHPEWFIAATQTVA